MTKVDEIMERWERRPACGEVDGQYLSMKYQSNVKRAKNDVPILIEEIKRLRGIVKEAREYANHIKGVSGDYHRGWYGALAHIEKELTKP